MTESKFPALVLVVDSILPLTHPADLSHAHLELIHARERVEAVVAVSSYGTCSSGYVLRVGSPWWEVTVSF